jgi:hypothetical protein
MGALLLGVRHGIPENRQWLRIAVDVPCGAAIYFAFLLLMKEEFVGEVLTRLKGRFARG